jgi:RsiW-degrading membrane proteinase PrsW (M82 family)
MQEVYTVLAAMAGGVLPALAWLWFWRREDSKHPEPRMMIALAFLAGMVAVAVVIPIEKYAALYLGSQTAIFTAWSFIEEITKYLAARISVLGSKEVDEPVDPVIYMVTVALGFAAAENTLFLLSPLAGNNMFQQFVTGNLRFVGATLLHVLASATIGAAIGFAFYKSKRMKALFLVGGLFVAFILHSVFNYLILNTPETDLLRTFAYVWIGVVALLAVLEVIKRVRPSWRR